MLFNSLLFLVFFVIVTITYYLLPHKLRWMWLLAASSYFYMYFKPVYILIILFTIIVDYCAGILIEKATGKTRRFYLILSLITNIGVLAFYKYFNFLAANLNLLSDTFHGPQLPLLDFILPIGLSFHTFQAMSYTIEVYRGNQPAERHFGLYALYVMFYPQMVAGPIERPQHILPQLHRVNNFRSSNLITGLFFMAMGLFKKVVIADRLGLYVDPVFNNPHGHSALELLVATYFFAFQIYCDFSGYSDIAVGTALVLGIELMQNFNLPYLASNVSDFWKRWHISLSTWFRDYLYIPLGGSKINFRVTCINLLIVFMISGLWHGANWKYLVWGLIHGLLLVAYQLFNKYDIGIKGFTFLKWLFTFNLVSLAWVFFRAATVSDAFYILSKILAGKGFTYSAGNLMSVPELWYCAFIIIILLLGERYLRKAKDYSNTTKAVIIGGLILACYFLGIFNEAQFIYFQF
ncbi:MBOAT family O-acyltransferase [Mucilaginibacter gossypii]|uniref:MBOAT family O-acyltransferase n=1 Tax=Mucilaginibacter TaxID=423349 RepID=UPI000DCD9D9D|nr:MULTISPECIES: MBOAT family O-acyltransferase [Mucilaginibacter]QTE36674.1 MBOAT family O-acyltransferase [Mucilaginibacter gossypii]RAV55515.1 MBOAT family protein [Mucilaginibacter rubeus]